MALTMCKIVECLKSYKQKMYKNGIKYGIRVKIGKKLLFSFSFLFFFLNFLYIIIVEVSQSSQ